MNENLFYAHLSQIDVRKVIQYALVINLEKPVVLGMQKNMITISNGAHLHFEERSQVRLGVGLIGRIDPIPFLSVKLFY